METRLNGDLITADWFNEIHDAMEYSGAIVGHTTITSDYTADLKEGKISINALSNSVTLTLPSAIGNTGKGLWVRVSDITNAASVSGVYTFSAVNQAIYLVSDGTNWKHFTSQVALDDHAFDHSTHGVTEIVGASEVQTLTNKTLTLPKINSVNELTSSSEELNQLDGVAVGGIASGDIVTIDDIQTMTNKTLTDCTLDGTTTIISSTDLNVSDRNISVNVGGNEASANLGAGLTIEMTDATDLVLSYDSSLLSRLKIDGHEIVTTNQSQQQVSPKINEDVVLTATSTELNQLDGVDVGGVVSGDIVTIDGTQIITNKALDGGTASSSNKWKVPSHTTVGLDALTDEAAIIAYDTDKDSFVGNKGAGWTNLGGGGGAGSSSIYQVYNLDDDEISSWNVSNLVTATFTEETTAPLNGLKSFKLTNAVGASGYIISPTVAVPLRARNKSNACMFQFTYTGTVNNISAYIYDVTNSAVISSYVFPINTSVSSQAKIEFLPTCNEIQLRIAIVTAEAATLLIDDIEFNDEPWKTADLQYINSVKLEGSDGRVITADTEDIHFIGSGTGWTSTGDTHYYTVQRSDSVVTVCTSVYFNSVAQRYVSIYKNGVLHKNIQSENTNIFEGTYVSKKGEFTVGDTLSLRVTPTSTIYTTAEWHYLNIVETATTVHVISASTQALEEQVDLTVTGTNWTTTRAVGTYYTTTDGAHRFRFNIRGTLSTGATGLSLSVSGVTFKNVSGFGQTVTVLATGVAPYTASGYVTPGSGNLGLSASSSSTDWRISGDVELDSKPTWGKTLESGLIVAMPAQRIAYVRVHATDEVTSVASTTSYKTQTLNSVTGDSIGASVASNRLTLPIGKYALDVPIGCNGNTEWVSLQLYNTGTSSQIVELTKLSHSTSATHIPFRDAHYTLTLTSVTTFEFRTKSVVAGSNEFMGTIKTTKLE